MDKKLLDALNNLADALDYLSESMKEARTNKDKSPTAEALTSNANLEKKIEALNKGVVEVQNDNKKILKNQEELLKIAKEQKAAQETGGPVGAAEDPKKRSRIKDGLATIMLIAVGILAIGMAFKLIGSINFLSVIGLSIAIVIISYAFEKVAKLGLTIKEAAVASIIMVVMSMGVTASSWVLSLIRPISIQQALTAVLIGAMFYFLLPAVASMIKAMESEDEVQFRGIHIKTKGLKINTVLTAAVALPLIMISISFGIAVSSWILSMVRPLSLPQILTVAGIGFLFSLLAPAISAIITGITTEEEVGIEGLGGFKKKGISMQSAAAVAILIPILMIGMSIAITAASYILGAVRPVGFFKLLTAVLISVAFSVLAYGLGKIIFAIGLALLVPGLAQKVAIALPIILIAMSAAIVGASWMFALIRPVSFMQILTAILISLVFIPLSFALPFIILGIAVVPIQKVFLIPVVLVLLATAIMLSSYLFNMTAAVPFMKLLNILVQAIVLSVIGIALSIAIIAVSLIGPSTAIKGGIVLVIMAGVIMAASYILNMGTYENYPKLPWILGVGPSLVAFTYVALVLGTLVTAGLPIMLAGAAAILVLSGIIVFTSMILASAEYTDYPGLDWSVSVAATIGAFAAIAIVVGLTLPLILLGSLAIFAITYVIIEVSKMFGENEFVSYPSLDWSIGVGASLYGFAYLAASLGLVGLLSLVGIPVMYAMAYTIVEMSNILSEGNYNIPGMAVWAASVALLYTVFTPILLVLAAVAVANAVVSAFGANPMEMARDMIINIAETIVEVADVLSKGTFTGGPTADWASGVAIALGAFSPIYRMLVMNKIFEAFGGGGVGPDDFNNAIRVVVGGIKYAALEFAGFSEMPYPSKAWAEGAGLAIAAFSPIYDILAKSKDGWLTSGGPTVEEFNKAIMTTVKGIVAAAKYFGDPENTGVFDTKKIPSKTWGENVGKAIEAFAPALAFITKNKGWFSDADPELIGKAIISTSTAIRDSSRIIKDGDYEKGIKKEWVTGTTEAVKGFTELAFWINEQDGIDSATGWLKTIAEKVRDTANILADGEYEKTVTSKWMSAVESSVLRYIALALIVSKTEGLEGQFNAPSISLSGASLGGYQKGALGKLAGVVRSMLDTSRVFSEISENMQDVDKDWMTNVSDNVHYYVELAKWLSESEVDTGFIMNAVNGMRLLSIGYSELARAIQSLSDSLEDLDVEKLTAIKNLNASVVLVSMMDPDQFSSMMDELEDRGGVLLDALEGVKEGEEPPKKGGSSPSVKTGGGGGEKTETKSMSDLYSIMEQVNEKLGNIASSSDKISKYVDEIRGDSPIKKKSWF